MGLLSNRIARSSLKSGDHIYSWRTAYVYAHHGIYMGDNKVIHFTRGGEEVGTGTALDVLLVSSVPKRRETPCPNCSSELTESSGVVSSCLDCFLSGGDLYRFEYSVNPAIFLAKVRGGTCTLSPSDPAETVVKRATHLLSNGFGVYNVFKSNCEDFAIYCKTGLLVAEKRMVGRSGQVISIMSGPLATVMPFLLKLVTTNVCGMVAIGVGAYCVSRYVADIGDRRDVVKLEVEELTSGLATGKVQVVHGQLGTRRMSLSWRFREFTGGKLPKRD